MNTRAVDILEYFINNPNTYTQIKVLSNFFNVSDKTIKNDIHFINEYLKSDKVQITFISRKGYFLEKEQIFRVNITKFKNSISEINSRYKSIMSVLLSIDDYVKISFLADMFFLSDSQMKNDLREIRKILFKYQMELISSIHGIKVEGLEVDKRRCIIKENIVMSTWNDLFSDREGIMDSIYTILYDELKKINCQMSNICFQNLQMHIYVAIKRIQNGDYLNINQHKENINNIELEISQNIFERLSKIFDFIYTQAEVNYLAFNIMGKRNYSNVNHNEQVQKLVESILDEIKEITGLCLKSKDLEEALVLHLIPLNIRMELKMPIQNPLRAEIQKNYPLAYEVAIVAALAYKRYTQLTLNDDEISYLALHFLMAIMKKEAQKKIILISDDRKSYSTLLQRELTNIFSMHVILKDTFTCNELSQYKNENNILLTTNEQFSNQNNILLIHNILNIQDIKNIRDRLDNGNQSFIRNLIKKELFFYIKEKKEKKEIIEFLCIESSQFYNCENIYDQVMLREKYGCTGLDNRIAIPHPHGLVTNKTFISVAILENAINWDGKPVQIIFLISIKKGEKEKMIDVFEKVSFLVRSPELINEFLKEPSYENFVNHLMTT